MLQSSGLKSKLPLNDGGLFGGLGGGLPPPRGSPVLMKFGSLSLAKKKEKMTILIFHIMVVKLEITTMQNLL
jgi:hypothetical protein